MKSWLRQLIALLVAALLAGILGGFAHAQAVDFEIGLQSPLVNTSVATPYLMVRDNVPLSSTFLGTKLWLLPELRVQTSPLDLTFRTQLLLDNRTFALFVDYWAKKLQEPKHTEMFVRFGLRFTLDLGAH